VPQQLRQLGGVAAIRRASSRVISRVAARRPGSSAKLYISEGQAGQSGSAYRPWRRSAAWGRQQAHARTEWDRSGSRWAAPARKGHSQASQSFNRPLRYARVVFW